MILQSFGLASVKTSQATIRKGMIAATALLRQAKAQQNAAQA